MSSIDPNKFGITKSLIDAVNEALKGGQVKIDKNHNGKIDGQDFKMLRKEEIVDEGNPANKEKKNAAAAAVGAKNKDSQYLTRIKSSVADKIRGREKLSGKDRQQFEEVEQVDEAGMSRREAGAHWDANKKSEKKSDTMADYKNKTAYQKAALAAKKKVSEGVEQVDEISTKLAVNYAKGALKSMDTAAAKGSDGHSTFMKRVAGHKLALDKTNPEHKRLKAKVGTTDANAKDAAYKKTVGEDVEQVDELSKATLGSYVNKSAASLGKAGYNAGSTDGTAAKLDPHINTINKRSTGIKRAVGKLAKEDTQIDELSTDTYHSAAKKAAKRAMGDAQGRSGPIFKKYAGMANKFRDKGMSQEKKEKAVKEAYDDNSSNVSDWSDKKLKWHKEKLSSSSAKAHSELVRRSKTGQTASKKTNEATDPRDSRPQTWRPNNTGYAWDKLSTRMTSDPKDSKAKKAGKLLGLKSSIKGALGSHGPKGKLPEETDPGFVAEADNPIAKQIAAKKDTFKKQLQQKIAAKQMNTMQAKANKRLSSINASNDKCSCQEGKGKSMTCEMHGDTKKLKGGKEPIEINPPLREAQVKTK